MYIAVQLHNKQQHHCVRSLTFGRWSKQVSDSVKDCRTATDVVGVKFFNLMVS